MHDISLLACLRKYSLDMDYGDVTVVPKLYNGILVLPVICHLEFFGNKFHVVCPSVWKYVQWLFFLVGLSFCNRHKVWCQFEEADQEDGS